MIKTKTIDNENVLPAKIINSIVKSRKELTIKMIINTKNGHGNIEIFGINDLSIDIKLKKEHKMFETENGSLFKMF